MSISLIRHQEIFNPVHHQLPVSIIGAGATGSRVFEALIKLGVDDLTVYDFDTVEPHNLANQLYGQHHVGIPKVQALAEWYTSYIEEQIPDSIRFINRRVPDAQAPLKGVVFLLTDTMESRREIFNAELDMNPEIMYVIETRMASSYGNILSFNPNNPLEGERWLATLIDDDEAEVSACGASISVGPTASVIANWAVWQYILLCRGEPLDARLNLNLQVAVLGAEKL